MPDETVALHARSDIVVVVGGGLGDLGGADEAL